jgi:hypothetical protein
MTKAIFKHIFLAHLMGSKGESFVSVSLMFLSGSRLEVLSNHLWSE